MGNLRAALRMGQQWSCQETRPSADLLKAVEQERCTAIYGVPTMFIAELEQLDRESFDSARFGRNHGRRNLSRAGHAGSHRSNAYERKSRSPMDDGVPPIRFQTSPDDPLLRRCRRSAASSRSSIASWLMKAARPCRLTPGELCTRRLFGDARILGEPQKTADAIDTDGFMTAATSPCSTSRDSEKSSANQGHDYPRRREHLSEGNRGISYRTSEVEDVAVVGLPDERYGEEVCAWIRLSANEQASEEEIREFAGRGFAHYKVPRFIRFSTPFR